MGSSRLGEFLSRNAGTISTICLVGSFVLQAASSLMSKQEAKVANQQYIKNEVKEQLPHLLNQK